MKLFQRIVERIHQICALPAEPAIRLRLATEMPISRSALVNGFVQRQMLANAPWSQIHASSNSLFDGCGINRARAKRIGIYR